MVFTNPTFTLVTPQGTQTFDAIEDCREVIETLIVDKVFAHYPKDVNADEDETEFSLQESFDDDIFELDYHSETYLTDTFEKTLDRLMVNQQTASLTDALLHIIDAKVKIN